MGIVINGTFRDGAVPATVQALVDALGLAGKRVAVELNGAVVPRSAYPGTALVAGDRVEVVSAVGGG